MFKFCLEILGYRKQVANQANTLVNMLSAQPLAPHCVAVEKVQAWNQPCMITVRM